MNSEKNTVPTIASALLTISMWAEKNNQSPDDVLELFAQGMHAFIDSGRLPASTECPVVYFARDAAAGALDPLAVLSREVFGLSDKLQQPADLVVQLMVLADLRGMRAEHKLMRHSAGMVFS